MRALLVLALALVPFAADAAICKYVDRDGAGHYTNVAPDQGWTKLWCEGDDDAPRKKAVPRKLEAQMSPAEKDKAWNAVQTCQAAIQSSLHDPYSAEYPTVSRSYRALEKSTYVVQVQVRARNGFNALRLNTMECRIDATSGKFQAIRELD